MMPDAAFRRRKGELRVPMGRLIRPDVGDRVSCEFCPFYQFKEYAGEKFCRDHRANYCAHPAYLESWREQYMGTSETGEPAAVLPSSCILCEPTDPQTVFNEVCQNRLFWEHTELNKP